MIRSFRNRETERIFRRQWSRSLQSVAGPAKRKPDQIQAALMIADLAAVPG